MGAPKATLISAPRRGRQRGGARGSGMTWSKPVSHIGTTYGVVGASRMSRDTPHLKRRRRVERLRLTLPSGKMCTHDPAPRRVIA